MADLSQKEAAAGLTEYVFGTRAVAKNPSLSVLTAPMPQIFDALRKRGAKRRKIVMRSIMQLRDVNRYREGGMAEDIEADIARDFNQTMASLRSHTRQLFLGSFSDRRGPAGRSRFRQIFVRLFGGKDALFEGIPVRREKSEKRQSFIQRQAASVVGSQPASGQFHLEEGETNYSRYLYGAILGYLKQISPSKFANIEQGFCYEMRYEEAFPLCQLIHRYALKSDRGFLLNLLGASLNERIDAESALAAITPIIEHQSDKKPKKRSWVDWLLGRNRPAPQPSQGLKLKLKGCKAEVSNRYADEVRVDAEFKEKLETLNALQKKNQHDSPAGEVLPNTEEELAEWMAQQHQQEREQNMAQARQQLEVARDNLLCSTGFLVSARLSQCKVLMVPTQGEVGICYVGSVDTLPEGGGITSKRLDEMIAGKAFQFEVYGPVDAVEAIANELQTYLNLLFKQVARIEQSDKSRPVARIVPVVRKESEKPLAIYESEVSGIETLNPGEEIPEDSLAAELGITKNDLMGVAELQRKSSPLNTPPSPTDSGNVSLLSFEGQNVNSETDKLLSRASSILQQTLKHGDVAQSRRKSPYNTACSVLDVIEEAHLLGSEKKESNEENTIATAA